MKRKLLWIISFALVLGAEAWFLWPNDSWEFQWEPFLLFLASIASFIGIAFSDNPQNEMDARNSEKRITSTDLNTFKEIKDVFSEQGFLQFVREHDFGGAYLNTDIEPLRILIRKNRDVEMSFIDAETDGLWKKLYKSAKNLIGHLDNKSFYIEKKPNSEFKKIYPEMAMEEELRFEAVNTANKMATEFHENYLEFYNYFKTKFGDV